MVRIVVIVDDVTNFKNKPYFLNLLITEWEKTGFEVVIFDSLKNLPEAEIVIIHVDLTWLPAPYQELSKQYQTVININATDISKRLVSCQKVDDSYSGPVIVKTNENYGGWAERKIRYKVPVIGRILSFLDRRRHWTTTGIIKGCNYPIYESLDKVPLKIWKNKSFVVERFIAERHDESYALR